MEPEILLYDEPTTGLYPIRANSINDLIVNLQNRLDVTSVVVTHDMNSVERVADFVAFLHDGVIHFEGTFEELEKCDDPVVRNFVEGIDENYRTSATTVRPATQRSVAPLSEMFPRTERVLAAPDNRMPCEEYCRLLKAATELSDEPNFPIYYGTFDLRFTRGS